MKPMKQMKQMNQMKSKNLIKPIKPIKPINQIKPIKPIKPLKPIKSIKTIQPIKVDISSDLHCHQKTVNIIFLKTTTFQNFVLKLVWVNIHKNIKGQPYFDSRNFLWILLVSLVTPRLQAFFQFIKLICIPLGHHIQFYISF